VYLKRLELQGFKSFANKTLFEFGPGVTAVVGPNGSGKSNVAESIRWVLGEQHSRILRARRLEDVIFSGSSQRNAVGMAEVSMTLDNAEGWLPVDYSEVVVSRRAYRNGDSEYLINKSKVRLRDVVDLFLRAQVGQNSYAFMGQGLVEEVLLMRPEERRRLLEEAADVRLLRTRLDEARDRLSATRDNLDRVTMLIEEIGPRLKQLEKQATRAAEHGRLASELAETLRELFAHLWRDAQDELTAARGTLDQKTQALIVVQNETKATEEGLAALTAAVDERQKEISERRGRHRSLSDQVHSLEQRLTFDAERVENHGRRRAEIDAELQSLRDERSDIQTSLNQTIERRGNILPDIEEAKGLIETRRQEMNTLEQEYAGLRRRVVEGEEAVARAQRGARDAAAAIERIAQEEMREEGEVERRAERQRDLLVHLRGLGREYDSLRRAIRVLDSQIADGEEERDGLTAMLETSRQNIQALEREAMQAEGQVTQLRAHEAMLLSLQNATEGVEAAARFLMGDETEEMHGKVAEGLVGLVQDVIRVPPGLERAIEAALAENVQALVFENLPSALAALEELEAHQAGRAILYPLDAVKSSPPLNLLRERGIIGVAARLVRCDNRFRNLVDALLGRIVVVETVQLAREVLRRGLGSVVTLDGVYLRPNGSVTGGASRVAIESFSRQRELEELPPKIAQAEARRREIESRLEIENEGLEGIREEMSRVEPALTELRAERTRQQSALQENRGRFILLRSEGRTLWNELARGNAVTDWMGRRQRLTEERAQYEADVREAAEVLERDREALEAMAPHRSATINAVSEAAAAHADLEGEARSLAKQIEILQANLTRADQRLRSREQSLAGLDVEAREIQERNHSLNAELTTARDALEALRAEMDPAEGEFAHLQSRARSMTEQLTAIRTRLLNAERAHIEAEAAVKLRTDELEVLRDTMANEGYHPEGSRVVAEVPQSVEPEGEVGEQGRLPPIRGAAEVDVDTLRSRVAELRRRIRALGPVNEQAHADYTESKERYDFLQGQVEDLTGSEATLQTAIDELEHTIRVRLKETFAIVDREFTRYFESFFNGGKAYLSLTQPDDFANTGIEIVAQPPGKRVNAIAMLSGGERTLTALALLVALLEAHPSPICVLDEVDAALDETNVGRFVDALRDLGKKTQFILITHNPRTIEAADSIYGVSMGSDSTSRILSLKLDDLKN
jgi:chromosome segregation protein